MTGYHAIVCDTFIDTCVAGAGGREYWGRGEGFNLVVILSSLQLML